LPAGAVLGDVECNARVAGLASVVEVGTTTGVGLTCPVESGIGGGRKRM
jgi:hypothetical protein